MSHARSILCQLDAIESLVVRDRGYYGDDDIGFVIGSLEACRRALAEEREQRRRRHNSELALRGPIFGRDDGDAA